MAIKIPKKWGSKLQFLLGQRLRFFIIIFGSLKFRIHLQFRNPMCGRF